MSVESKNHSISSDVRNKLNTVRQKRILYTLAIFFNRSVFAIALIVAVLAVADFFWMFSWPVRATLAGVAFIALISTIIQSARQRRKYLLSDAAASVEAQYPQHGQIIRTSLDYSGPETEVAPAAPGLIAAMEKEADQQTRSSNFDQAISPKPAILSLIAILVLLVVCLSGLIAVPELWVSTGRSLLLPIHYSSLTVQPTDEAIPVGQNVTIHAEVTGRPVKEAMLLFRQADTLNDWKAIPLEPSEQSSDQDIDDQNATALTGPLSATIEDCRNDVEFKVIADYLEAEVQQIRVLQPLEMESFAARIQSPEYTRRETQTVEELDIKVIEGADINFELALNRAPAEAFLTPSNTENQDPPEKATRLPLEIKNSTLVGELNDLKMSQQFVISARTADGIDFESERFRIRVQPDGKPRIRFVRPPEELEVTPTTEVALTVDANDDFGIKKIGLYCKIADGAMKPLWEKEYSDDTPDELRLEHVLFLEEQPLTYQDAVTYYAYVEDNHPEETRRTLTELRFIDIRPYKQEYQIMPSSSGGSGGT